MSKLSTLEILRWGRELLREHYTGGVRARNKSGLSVEAGSSTAVQWCTIGVFHAFASGRFRLTRHHTLGAEQCLLNASGGNIIGVSDAGHESAIAMWDRAIKLAETEAADGK